MRSEVDVPEARLADFEATSPMYPSGEDGGDVSAGHSLVRVFGSDGYGCSQSFGGSRSARDTRQEFELRRCHWSVTAPDTVLSSRAACGA